MIENMLGWLLLAIAVVVPVMLVYASVRMYRKHKTKQQEATPSVRKSTSSYSKNVNYSKSSYSSTPPTSSSSSNDSLLSDLATLYVLNSALSHGSASAKVDYDTGTIKTDNSSSSSWGLDDSDSRKSISSSMDTSSWGSSSSSSDSWSSSDSGPSSDW